MSLAPRHLRAADDQTCARRSPPISRPFALASPRHLLFDQIGAPLDGDRWAARRWPDARCRPLSLAGATSRPHGRDPARRIQHPRCWCMQATWKEVPTWLLEAVALPPRCWPRASTAAIGLLGSPYCQAVSPPATPRRARRADRSAAAMRRTVTAACAPHAPVRERAATASRPRMKQCALNALVARLCGAA